MFYLPYRRGTSTFKETWGHFPAMFVAAKVVISNKMSRCVFVVTKPDISKETSGHFPVVFVATSHETRSNPDPHQVVFVPKPNKTLSTELPQYKN